MQINSSKKSLGPKWGVALGTSSKQLWGYMKAKKKIFPKTFLGVSTWGAFMNRL